MAYSSGRSIKRAQHALYAEDLRKIEAGERAARSFAPRSDFGQLRSSVKLQKKFSFV